jgi:cytochrome c
MANEPFLFFRICGCVPLSRCGLGFYVNDDCKGLLLKEFQIMKLNLVIAAAALAAFATGAFADDPDLKKGAKVFKKCKACHVIDKEKNKVGPHLVGLIGRKTASVESYKYSKAMIAKGEEGLEWTEEVLLEYLVKPKAYVKGTKMAFGGLKKEKDRINLVAYLKENAKLAE